MKMTIEQVIRNLNALNTICGQKDFYDKEMEESLRFAINSLKVDVTYQFEYEKPIPIITLDELKAIRGEIYGYYDARYDLSMALKVLDKKIAELEGKDGNDD